MVSRVDRAPKTPALSPSPGAAPRPAKATPVDGVDALRPPTDVDALRSVLAALRPAPGSLSLLTPDAVTARCQALADKGVRVEEIGRSKEGRPLFGLTVGQGDVHLGAIAAAHSDEPLGTVTALHLAEAVATRNALESVREQATLHIVPLADPDGAAVNAAWVQAEHDPLDLHAYFAHVQRNTGAADTEFAFPARPGGNANPQNVAIARWFDAIDRIDHYVSLHSIFLSSGAWFLVDAADRRAVSSRLRFLLDEATREGLPLHDEPTSRMFERIAPGLSTAPRAGSLGMSTRTSMEYVRAHCGATLAMVTELPLCFLPDGNDPTPLSATRAQTARAKHAEAWKQADAAASLGRSLSELELGAEGRRHLARYQSLTGRGHGEASLPRGELTRGDVVYADASLLRRRALYLGAALGALRDAKGGDDLRARVERDFEGAVTAFARGNKLKRVPLETQAHLQMAAILSGLLPTL